MFLFGFSFTDFMILAAALTVAGGYKTQFLGYSRRGGVFVGRVVGYIRKSRDQLFTSKAAKAELVSVQQQLAEAMGQLQSLRHDIRSSTTLTGGGDFMSAEQQAAVNAQMMQQSAFSGQRPLFHPVHPRPPAPGQAAALDSFNPAFTPPSQQSPSAASSAQLHHNGSPGHHVQHGTLDAPSRPAFSYSDPLRLYAQPPRPHSSPASNQDAADVRLCEGAGPLAEQPQREAGVLSSDARRWQDAGQGMVPGAGDGGSVVRDGGKGPASEDSRWAQPANAQRSGQRGAMQAATAGNATERPASGVLNYPGTSAAAAGAPAWQEQAPLQRFEQLNVSSENGKMVYIADVPLIPVSAEAAGRLPKRRGPLTGSDIAEDALAEQEVARQASAVLSGGPV